MSELGGLYSGPYDLGISIKYLEGQQRDHVAPLQPNTVESGSTVEWDLKAEGATKQQHMYLSAFEPADKANRWVTL